ncbi:cytochrome P450 hydroxylase [Streptomyces capoamus]|uniref:Cytochrome P450 hydroxylase n=1 Tax=Streptomyces capoamus TaxID=68183 RepID=A0A919EZD3_9ACTN|nr:cytochrome P450 [Streptomyces capoamus]GGW18017.1 cytochrome P450 hydroxylase [Streptomyces libani subsp. rufus]GHG63528.1 cytochrome P450 hydroxylase [Streptomyces capoamus]
MSASIRLTDLHSIDDEVALSTGPAWQWLPRLTRGHRFVRWQSSVVLTTYADCRVALSDRRFGNGLRAEIGAMPDIDPRFVERRRSSLLLEEGERHTRLRRLAIPALRPRNFERFRPAMAKVVDELVDRVADHGRCDAVVSFCNPLPISVICWVLGVPRAEAEFFAEVAEASTALFSGDPSTVSAAMAATEKIDSYIEDLIGRRRRDPGQDLITDLLAAAEADGATVSGTDVMTIITSLIVGGTDTTRNQLAIALHCFAERPEEWERLRRRPELVPAAVEEVVRYAPTAYAMKRVADEDMELDGLLLPKGTPVIVMSTLANRDESVFPEPDRFDIGRTFRHPHMGFGWGLRSCIGSVLARAELGEALTVLSRRLTGLALDGETVWSRPDTIQGPVTLPLRFEAV